MKHIFEMTKKETFKLFLRRLLAAILFYTGINALYRLVVTRHCALVLAYHRVTNTDQPEGHYLQRGMYVTTDAFKMHMEYLSSKYRVVSLQKLVESLTTRSPLGKNTCVITFDDGWKDTYTHAIPLLRRYSLPATVFLVSDYVDTTQRFWTDKVSHLLTNYFRMERFKLPSSGMYPALEDIGFFHLIVHPLLTPSQRIEKLIETMKDLDASEMERVLSELDDLFHVSRPQESNHSLTLNWDQVIEMSRSNITFGSHTKTHVILTKAPKQTTTREIVDSQRQLEQRLSTSCWAFSYPNGDYDDDIKRIVTEHYACAFTADNGFVRPTDPLFDLKRIGIHNDTTCTKAMFACRLTGLLP